MSVDYTAFAGDTIEIIVSAVDEDGAALDVTGATAIYVLAKTVYSAALVTKTSMSGITIAEDEIVITLAPADTASFPVDLSIRADLYHHELELTDGDDNVSTLLYGDVQIKRTVINGE